MPGNNKQKIKMKLINKVSEDHTSKYCLLLFHIYMQNEIPLLLLFKIYSTTIQRNSKLGSIVADSNICVFNGSGRVLCGNKLFHYFISGMKFLPCTLSGYKPCDLLYCRLASF